MKNLPAIFDRNVEEIDNHPMGTNREAMTIIDHCRALKNDAQKASKAAQRVPIERFGLICAHFAARISLIQRATGHILEDNLSEEQFKMLRERQLAQQWGRTNEDTRCPSTIVSAIEEAEDVLDLLTASEISILPRIQQACKEPLPPDVELREWFTQIEIEDMLREYPTASPFAGQGDNDLMGPFARKVP